MSHRDSAEVRCSWDEEQEGRVARIAYWVRTQVQLVMSHSDES